MATFRLVKGAGRHTEGGKTYHAGDEVESDKPLHQLFQNKFEVVDASGLEETEEEAPEGQAIPDVVHTARGPRNRTQTPFDTDDTPKSPPVPLIEAKDNQVGEEGNEDAGESEDESDEEETGSEEGEDKPRRAARKPAAKRRTHR